MSWYFFTIDPSINYTGIALHCNYDLLEYDLIRPVKDARKEFITKAGSVTKQVQTKIYGYINKYDIDIERLLIVYELPEHWGIAGFHAREKGSMQKLQFLCGSLQSLLGDDFNVRCLTPSVWKGQIPKNVMKNRIKKDYPKVNFDDIRHDVMDAIGIGSYIIVQLAKYDENIGNLPGFILDGLKWS